MAYVITESCIATATESCRDADSSFPCVEACPVDGIYGTPDDPQLYVAADECIECADCFVVCPANAIFVDVDVPQAVRALNITNYNRTTLAPAVP